MESKNCIGKPGTLALLAGLVLLAVLILPSPAIASMEESFDVLQVGTATYSNVTVTTKSPGYIFIVFTGGMTSVKVQDLPVEAKIALGYAAPEPSAVPHKEVSWSNQISSRMDTPQVSKYQRSFHQIWGRYLPSGRLDRASIIAFLRSKPGMIMLAALLLFHVFHACCVKLIVEKTGENPDALVWVPVLNTIPLVRAAGMSAWSALGMYVPILNIAVYIVWSLRIARARGKSVSTAVCLMLPGLNVIAFLYLAFSAMPPAPVALKAVEIMSLEAA